MRVSTALLAAVFSLFVFCACGGGGGGGGGGSGQDAGANGDDGGSQGMCGDGVVNAGEICDDGSQNGTISDTEAFCSTTCQGTQLCGNGAIEGSETCDDGDANGNTSTTEDVCSATCEQTQRCGNGVIEGNEVCDDGTDNGVVSTTANNCILDCTGTQRCGNNMVEGSEECDGTPGCSPLCSTIADADGDGISDVDEGVDTLLDSDSDGVPDYQDTDSDDDGIPDAVEAGDTSIDTNPVDSDMDGTPDFQDTDSDDDGFTDMIEAGADPTMPADTDSDTTPDYLDVDSDNDLLSDADEFAYGTDRTDVDSDGDTITDGQEGIGDPDGDMIVNALDDDSDGDGFTDAQEAGDADVNTPSYNTDSDSFPDFLDLDSDQDGLPDSNEVNCVALGKHGRVFGDTDNDGFSDLAEFSVGSDPCDNTSGVTDIADFFFVLPYNDPEQNDVLVFTPTVNQADVFFNVDTTGSMGGEIANLQSGISSIIATTQAQVSDAGFGVGAYDDFPVDPFGGSAQGDVPFALHQGITTNTTAATNAVNGLTTHWGNDFPESGYEALYQIANGSGVFGSGGNFGPFTAAGRTGGAQFRSGSLPIVVHVTDALSHDATTPSTAAGFSWTSDYPAAFNDHSKAQALAELSAIGARVITVESFYGGTLAAIDTVVGAQLEEISDTTGAVVPVCAFKTDAVNWRCGANTCCDGTIDNGAGQCILRYLIAGDGSGLSSSASDGIKAIVKYTTFQVYNQPRDDGDAGTVDTSLFLDRVESLAYVPPPQEPEQSCNPTAVPASYMGAGFNNGFSNFAVGSSLTSQPGSKLNFTVYARNTTVMETSTPQLFTTFIDIIDVTTGAVLDTQSVVIIIPAAVDQ